MKKDHEYMRRAAELAMRAKGMTSPNPIVGCVIVRGNKTVGEGWHKHCGGDHAEVAALKKAGQRARRATMYVTLEPCFHYGRTPPCVDAVIESGIKEVVIGMTDPNPLTCGKSIAKLRRAGIKVRVDQGGVELKEINESFIKYMKRKMPFIAAKIAQSLDGKIATARGQSKWITSSATRQVARKKRDEFDAILVGINTVVADDPRLNGVRKRRALKKIVVDTDLRLSGRARLFQGVPAVNCIVATSSRAPAGKVTMFRKKGVQVLLCPLKRSRIDLRWLFKKLAKQEITSILIEGGAHVIGAALKEKLVDKMYIYMAPRITGDQNALSSVVGLHLRRFAEAVQLKDIRLQRIGRDILVEGHVYRNH